LTHMRAGVLCCLVIPVVLSTLCFAAKTKKTATPAEGDKTPQTVDVNNPYCDAYAPYTISGSLGARHITPLLNPLKFDFSSTNLNDKEEIERFLNGHLKTGDPIKKDGSFSDPGYPLLGDPKQHLYADGTDMQRLLARLFAVDASGSQLMTPLCKDPSTKAYADIAAPLNPNAQDTSSYYLIHIVRWKMSKGAYQTAESSWYVFNKNDAKGAHRHLPFTFHPYTTGDLRILGSGKVFFLAVHLAPIGATTGDSVQPPNAPQQYADFRQKVKASYKLAVTKIEPANIQDLKALVGIILKSPPAGNAAVTPTSALSGYIAFVNSSTKRTFAGAYGAAVLTGLQNLPVQITATMEASLPKADKSTPTDLPEYADLSGDHIQVSNQKPEATPEAPADASQTGKQSESAKTSVEDSNKASASSSAKGSSSDTGSSGSASTGKQSAPTSGCSNPSDSTCTDKAVIQNEGLYWWDVSVGVPFKGYKELQYDTTNGGAVTPKTVSKGSAYGFVMLAPWKEDIVDPPSLGIPHFLIGLPLQGKVFDAPVFAMGETFNLRSIPKIGPAISKVYPVGLRFYAGVVYNKQFSAPMAGISPTPSHRVAKLQYGIEFSVRSIASKLSSASSSKKSTPATSGNSKTSTSSNSAP
jgi:hypothetical protein